MTFRLKPAVLILVIVLLGLGIVGVYWGYRAIIRDKHAGAAIEPDAQPELKRMVNLPPKRELVPLPAPPQYRPDAPVLEQARRALRDGISPNEAFQLAQSLPESPERADAAFLLLEYAAEAGHPQAAMTVAGYYDPNHKAPSGTIRKNPETAFAWYRQALTAGRQEARGELAALRRWVAEKADQGSLEARELLQRWPSDH